MSFVEDHRSNKYYVSTTFHMILLWEHRFLSKKLNVGLPNGENERFFHTAMKANNELF